MKALHVILVITLSLLIGGSINYKVNDSPSNNKIGIELPFGWVGCHSQVARDSGFPFHQWAPPSPGTFCSYGMNTAASVLNFSSYSLLIFAFGYYAFLRKKN